MRRPCLFLMIAGLAAVVVPALPCQAAAAQDEEPKIDCANASSTYEMNMCGDRELQAADAKLNDIYKQALQWIAKTDADKPYDSKTWEAKLRASQRAWIAFRDADCKDLIPMSWGGGTGTTADVLGCPTEKTKVREQEIRRHFDLN